MADAGDRTHEPDCHGGVQILIRTIELARDLPAALTAFAIRELWREVITAEGPAVEGRAHYSRVLDARDVALLRQILEAGTGAVSAEEAEALFDLHDAVAGSQNDASFDDLFFRAVTNYIGRRGAVPCGRLIARAAPRHRAGNCRRMCGLALFAHHAGRQADGRRARAAEPARQRRGAEFFASKFV